jgi:3-deoxy-D-manno-octulosonate 8-phosphate phosphatase (KDO 8-P phosphatase)
MLSSKGNSNSHRSGISKQLEEKLSRIRLVVLDVDGVMTDGRIVYDDRGVEYKFFDVHDGLGIVRGRENGLIFAIVTGRSSESVTKRAEELGIREVHQSVSDKLKTFSKLKAKYQLDESEICCIGDDENDLQILNAAGVSVAPSNAMETVRSSVDLVTTKAGGRGAVRELIDAILRAKHVIQ